MKKLFEGIKVLDCTRVFSWPFASRYFADYGAEVVKIETEENYDEARWFSPMIDWKSAYFDILNRGKKSINLDLKNSNDLEIFYEEVKKADIFLENFSPKIKYRLKIDYETLRKINPKLIYGSLNGYWENTDKKAYDTIIQAECWLTSLSGIDQPMKNATSIIDSFSGVTLALGITSLLYKREQTGKWDFVNIPMIAWWIQLLEQNLTATSSSWNNPEYVGNHDSAIFPFWFFKTWDGEISLAIWNDTLWKIFSDIFLWEYTVDALTNSQRLQKKEVLTKYIEKKFSDYTTGNLLDILTKKWIPCSAINTMTDLLENTNLYKEKYIKELKDDEGNTYSVPYEFLKYKSYNIEEIAPSPEIEWK